MIDQSIALVSGMFKEHGDSCKWQTTRRTSHTPPNCGRSYGFYPKTTQNRNRVFFSASSPPSPFLLHFASIGNSFTAKIVLFSSAFPFPAGPPLFYVNTTRRTRRIDKLSGFDDHVRFIVALPPERIFVVEHALMRARELVINAFIEKRDSIRHHFRLLE